jgi:pilus assembly protein CpaC
MIDTFGRRQVRPMTIMHERSREYRRVGALGLRQAFVLLFVTLVVFPSEVVGQDIIQTAADHVITVSRGSTAILTRPDSITRISMADPAIAEPVVIPPNQVLINAIEVGSTSLIVWGRSSTPRLYTIEVTADIASLQRQVDDLFPGAGLSLTSTGTSVVLSGQVRDPAVVRKALELANTQGIPVVNNVDSPPPEQILLKVEFAEVSRSTMEELGGDLVKILNPAKLGDAFDRDGTHLIETLSEGFVTLLIEGDEARLDAVIRALKNTGEFRSLAKPNLVTREGQEATFLAGGEFPFPTIQGGGNTNAVTITWKEFGVRLNFVPDITNSGNIRLRVAPEVSSLDFANGLTYEGFSIPSILVRRVETDVELRPGQTLAIGGLLNNTMLEDIDKIPLLGDIPILGFFFRSKATRQERTELLVLVTPHVLDTDNLPTEALPTGEAEDWDWDGHIRNTINERPDTTSRGSGRN